MLERFIELWKEEEQDWHDENARLRRYLALAGRYLKFWVEQRSDTIDWEDGGPGEVATARRFIARVEKMLGPQTEGGGDPK